MSGRSIAVEVENSFGAVVGHALCFRVAISIVAFKFSFPDLISLAERQHKTHSHEHIKLKLQMHFSNVPKQFW